MRRGRYHCTDEDSPMANIQQALDGVPACRCWAGWNQWVEVWIAAAALEQQQADIAGFLRRAFADP